jgi:hypothetical protein
MMGAAFRFDTPKASANDENCVAGVVKLSHYANAASRNFTSPL